MKTGLMLNIFGGLIVFLATTTWMIPIFNLKESFIISNVTSNNLTLF